MWVTSTYLYLLSRYLLYTNLNNILNSTFSAPLMKSWQQRMCDQHQSRHPHFWNIHRSCSGWYLYALSHCELPFDLSHIVGANPFHQTTCPPRSTPRQCSPVTPRCLLLELATARPSYARLFVSHHVAHCSMPASPISDGRFPSNTFGKRCLLFTISGTIRTEPRAECYRSFGAMPTSPIGRAQTSITAASLR